MEDSIYTGREVAVFTDAHGLYEPTKAALEDMSKRGIMEIYSLGDNVGVGPNPNEVIKLLHDYGVKSVAGNSEEYCTLGIEPFASYFNGLKEASQLWTLSKLDEESLGQISLYPRYIELSLGGKKLALCHFANDVRFDYDANSTWSYQSTLGWDPDNAHKQFLYTNSKEQLIHMEKMIAKYGKDSPMMRGYMSALKEPLFDGKTVDFYDAIIQGHVHFKIYDEVAPTKFYSIRAVGMAYGKDPIDTASYVILREKKNNQGFEMEEVLVKFDREKMETSILSSGSPDTSIRKFTNMRS